MPAPAIGRRKQRGRATAADRTQRTQHHDAAAAADTCRAAVASYLTELGYNEPSTHTSVVHALGASGYPATLWVAELRDMQDCGEVELLVWGIRRERLAALEPEPEQAVAEGTPPTTACEQASPLIAAGDRAPAAPPLVVHSSGGGGSGGGRRDPTTAAAIETVLAAAQVAVAAAERAQSAQVA
eukprot:COSAG05_NODE_4211_length_1618_cov_2.635945_1_plen_183_part_10